VLFSATGGYTVIWVYGVTGYAVAALLIFATRRPTQPESAGAGSEV
jgi:hypothetical protein